MNTTYSFSVGSFLLLGSVGMVGKYLLHLSPKQLSWSLTLLNSFVSTLCSLIYIYFQGERIWEFLTTGNQSLGEALLESSDWFSSYFCLWFGIFNVFDLVFGSVFYFQEMGLLTALIHHPFYIAMMPIAIYGKVRAPFASAFLFMSIEELPTFLLALGTVVPTCRTDVGFGLTFFILRIVFHFFLLCMTVYLKLSYSSFLIPFFPFLLHIFWFRKWFKHYVLNKPSPHPPPSLTKEEKK